MGPFTMPVITTSGIVQVFTMGHMLDIFCSTKISNRLIHHRKAVVICEVVREIGHK